MIRFIKVKIIQDLERLEERAQRFMSALMHAPEAQMTFRPGGDFYETPEGLRLRLEVPGVALEDLSVALAGQELIVRGIKRWSPPPGVSRFLHQEISHGRFERSFRVPIPVEVQEIQAQLSHGILEVHLPRKQPSTRRIPVTALTESE